MRYFVIGPDGQKYGPGDIATLNQWVSEGRINANTYLEDATTGQRMLATTVPGLFLGPQTQTYNTYQGTQTGYQNSGYSSPPAYQQYPRGGGYGSIDIGADDVKRAWGFGIAGLLCCPIFLCPVGIYFAMNAQRNGNQQAKAPLIFNIVVLLLTGGAFFFMQILGAAVRG